MVIISSNLRSGNTVSFSPFYFSANNYRQEAENYGFAKFYDQVIDFICCEKELVVDNNAFDKTTYLIAFRNAYLDTVSKTVNQLDHRLFFTRNINLDFNDELCQCPNFDQFLWEISGGNRLLIARIYEVIGITLSNDLNAKALFCLQGVTNSAKSTLIKFVSSFFDDKLVTALSVGDMDKNFALAELIGKAMCIDTELTAAPIRSGSVARMKQLTSKDLLSTDVKYRARVSYVNMAKIFLATNHPFQLDVKDDAFMKRVVVIPFYYEIPKDKTNPEILRLFEYEKIAIAKKAIAHYCALRERRYIFSGDFRVNEIFAECRKTNIEVLSNQSDWITHFLQNYCILTTMDEFEANSDLYKAYKDLCVKQNVFPADQKVLTSSLKELLGDKVKEGKRRLIPGENPKHVLFGIKLKPL